MPRGPPPPPREGRRRRRRAAPPVPLLAALLTGRAAAALQHCEEALGGETGARCPSGSSVACWSEDASLLRWTCWPANASPSWGLAGEGEQEAADAVCRVWPAPAGSAAGQRYKGACRFGGDPAAGRRLNDDELPEMPGPVVELLSWDDGYAKAAETLAQMTPEEKYTLMRGVAWVNGAPERWWYIGSVPGVPRLGIPSLNLQDASSGFRTIWKEIVGTVTTWPSLLALAASWEPQLAKLMGTALGVEFSGKGANGILGPCVNVHRVARGGRNFECMSGEDPHLGARMAEAYVQGVQSQGILTVVKHWVMNEQETNRDSESSDVDRRTARELYYPPFEAAIKAGAGAVMCSYNRINGKYSCANSETLQDMKQGLGFRGFIQSDWGATTETSVSEGLDMEMGDGYQEIEHFSKDQLAGIDAAAVDDAVTRILASIYRLRLDKTTKCSPPNCKDYFVATVTSDAHISLARSIAARSIVLLRNEGQVLPLRSGSIKTIALIGGALTGKIYDATEVGAEWNKGDYYSGGGSGHMTAQWVVNPLDGIQARAQESGFQVLTSPSDVPEEAVKVAQQADIAIVVASTTSGEAMDRNNLNLDNGADQLISQVAGAAKKTVVLMQLPGAILMPWKDQVDGIMAMFYGGQETGHAWADVLFGDLAPRGRLPISMPLSDGDTIAPEFAHNVPYGEGLATGYRNKGLQYTYHFGHGLTYTTFEYLPLSLGWSSFEKLSAEGGGEKVRRVKARVRNSGDARGSTVVQLYLELPDYPAPVLKGFHRTEELEPGAVAVITFELRELDLSVYNQDMDAWVRADGVMAHVGESSEDIRQTVKVARPKVKKPEGPGKSPVVVVHEYKPPPPRPTPGYTPPVWRDRASFEQAWTIFSVTGAMLALSAGVLAFVWRFRVALFGDYKRIQAEQAGGGLVTGLASKVELELAHTREVLDELHGGVGRSSSRVLELMPVQELADSLSAAPSSMPADQRIAVLLALIGALTIAIGCLVLPPRGPLYDTLRPGHRGFVSQPQLQEGIATGETAFRVRWAAHPGKCLDVKDGMLWRGEHGPLIQLWDCFDSPSQVFVFRDGRIHWKTHPSMCLSVVGQENKDGARLQIWECLDEGIPGRSQQVWQIPAAKRSRLEGLIRWDDHPDKCMDVTEHALSNGNEMQLWTCWGGDSAQDMLLEPLVMQ